MSDLLVDLISGVGLRWIAAGILTLLVAATIWQAMDNEAYGTGYVAAGFASFWVVIELVVRAWRSRRV
jgi:hypothetical protein